jgi:TetR/AcrR family transcriptional regulator, repressor for uid operon
MPKLKPDTQRARREHILDAAEQCFAREGFHATTMQDICKEAAVSPGALYVYFTSKEALIEGICERDRAEFQARFSDLTGSQDFFAALSAIGEKYFVEEPVHKRRMCVEIGMESTRNPRVGAIFRSVDDFVHDSFQDLFQRLKDEGRIAPALDIPALAKAFCIVGDGMFWRRAIDPAFDGKVMIPAMVALIQQLLNPVPPPALSSSQAPIKTKAVKVTS